MRPGSATSGGVFSFKESSMQIIIHTCKNRIWYVTDYLVPALQKQGLEEITIYNDKYGIGNLLSFVLSCRNALDAYHLQDDVIICKDFAKRIEDHNDGIVCGFSSNKFELPEYVEGETTPAHMGFSFPCIRIPGKVARGFYKWFNTEETKSKYAEEIKTGKMDDLLFKAYLIEKHPEIKVTNLKPSLVDHIDYLLGGSQVNKAREGRHKEVRATYFNDLDLVKRLESDLIGRRQDINE